MMHMVEATDKIKVEVGFGIIMEEATMVIEIIMGKEDNMDQMCLAHDIRTEEDLHHNMVVRMVTDTQVQRDLHLMDMDQVRNIHMEEEEQEEEQQEEQ